MIVGFSNTATEDELKAAWMYMEWLSQPENLYTFQWGIEGENYNLDEEGNPVTVSDYNGDYKQGFNNSKDYWCIVKEKRTFDTVEENIKADTPQDLPQNFTDDIIKYYYDRLAIADQYGLSDCQFSVVIAAQSEYQNTLGELYKEFRDALTMCKQKNLMQCMRIMHSSMQIRDIRKLLMRDLKHSRQEIAQDFQRTRRQLTLNKF